ncbi:uncharacterized protein in vnfD 5'region-like [Planococcus citri]|uniref:uncharacterized protein in vnfD 5'region-like n=1 Tax=Planococcus citri TaxID=170843 RepID=UPI0031F7AE81
MKTFKMSYFKFFMFAGFLVSCTIAVDANTSRRKILPMNLRSAEECFTKNAIYVDKTDIALKLIQTAGKYSMLLRPRRFGKTFLINTIASILEGKKEFFKNTFIGDEKSGYEWQPHTVIKLTFQQHDSIMYLADELVDIAEDFGVDRALNHIKPTDPLYFMRLLRKIAPRPHLEKSKPEKLPVAVLIDEYDLPFKNANDETRHYFQQIFIILKALSDDNIIKFILFTGCNKANLISPANTGLSTTLGIRDISLDPVYASVCGFTDDEIEKYFNDSVQEKAKIHQVEPDIIFNEIKSCYDGYRFTETPVSVYNPISLLYYLNDKNVLRGLNYWIETQNHPKTAMEALVEARMKSRSVILNLKTYYNPNTLFQPLEDVPVIRVGATSNELNQINLNQVSLETILFQNGYLTIQDYFPKRKQYKLKFPNKEIRGAFMYAIELAMGKENECLRLHKAAKESLQNLNIAKLEETFRSFIQQYHFESLLETTTTDNESIVKAILRNLLSLGQPKEKPFPELISTANEHASILNVQPEVETEKVNGGKGKIYLLIETSRHIIMVEGKYGADETKMEQGWIQLENYNFPDSDANCEKIKARLLLNFDNQGFYNWRGATYYANGTVCELLKPDKIFTKPIHL